MKPLTTFRRELRIAVLCGAWVFLLWVLWRAFLYGESFL